MQVYKLEDQIIWLTGASSGIGKDLLELLLQHKATVIASSRILENIKYLQEKYPNQLRLIPVDVADPESVKACISEIAKQYPLLDKIILNAGICEYFDMPGFDGECIRKNFAVNFFGMINCIEHSWNLLMSSPKPHLIGVSSAAAFVAIPRAEGYGASKAAALYMLSALQAHAVNPKLDVTVVCPGFVETPLTAKNTFAMPLLWKSKTAAEYIFNGIVKRRTSISFPWLLVICFKIISMLPDFIRIKILARAINK